MPRQEQRSCASAAFDEDTGAHAHALRREAAAEHARRSLVGSMGLPLLFAVVAVVTPYHAEHPFVLGAVAVAILGSCAVRILLSRRTIAVEAMPSEVALDRVTLASAIVWSFFATLTFLFYSLRWPTMMVLLVTAGIAASASTSLSIHGRTAKAYVTIVLVPVISAALALRNVEAAGVAAVITLFLAFLIIQTERQAASYWKGLEERWRSRLQAEVLESTTRALDENRTLLRTAFEANLDGIFIYESLEDAEGRRVDFRIQDVNQRACEICGLLREEMVARTLSEVFPERFHETFALFERAIGTGAAVSTDVETTTAGLTATWTRYRVSPLPWGVVVSVSDITATRRSEELLQLSEARYRAIARHMPNGVVALFDRGFQLVVLDGGGLALRGLDRAELVGKPVSAACPAEEFAILEPAFRRALEGELSTIEVPFPGGVYLAQIGPVRGDDDAILGGLMVSHDMTAAKVATVRLKAQLDFTAAVLDTLDALVIVLDRSGCVLRFNGACERTTGYGFSELSGKPFWSLLIPADEIDRVRTAFDGICAGDFPARFENQWISKDGSPRSISWANTALLDAQGEPEFIIGTGIDVTDQRRTERELARQSAIITSVLKNMVDGVIVTDEAGTFALYNSAAEKMLGRGPEHGSPETWPPEFGLFLEDGATPLESNNMPLRRALAGEHVEQLPILARTPACPEGRWHSVTSSPIHNADGAIIGSVSVARDVTETRRGEARLRDAYQAAEEAARAKSEFLATMSHEIRTPLNGIIGMTALMMHEPMSAQQRERAEIVQISSETLLSLVNDVLDYSKLEANGVELEGLEIDPRALAEGVILIFASQAHGKGVSLLLDVDPALPERLVGDGGRLRQILINLVGNAIKFTDSGSVRLQVTVERQGGAAELVCAVEDTGIGMDTVTLGRLFKPFSQADGSTQRKYGGTGLGLAIAERFVRLMKGTITVESQPGAGTRFLCRIPITVGASLTQQQPLADVVALVEHRSGWGRIVQADLRALGVSTTPDETIGSKPCVSIELPAESNGVFDVAFVVGAEARRVRLSYPWRLRHLRDGLMQALGRETRQEDVRIGSARKVALRVLVVEDNRINQKVVTGLLDLLGCVATVVGDGPSALAAFTTSSFDLVFMDFHLPGMDGATCTREIRRIEKAARRVPIVAMTASALPADRERCFAAGMDDFVSKPLRSSDLERVLARFSPEPEGEAACAPEPTAALCPPPADLPLCDAERVEMLKDVGVWEELLEELEIFVPSARAALREAGERHDVAALITVVHQVAGCSANLGLVALADLSRRTESDARQLGEGFDFGVLADMDALLQRTLAAVTRRPTGPGALDAASAQIDAPPSAPSD